MHASRSIALRLKMKRDMFLQGLHDAGLVHRDVKPLNIIFAEEERRFKLIDLGACADLRSGTNYNPDESILDATYCPPEQVGDFASATAKNATILPALV